MPVVLPPNHCTFSTSRFAATVVLIIIASHVLPFYFSVPSKLVHLGDQNSYESFFQMPLLGELKTTSGNATRRLVAEFERQDDVVVATKIHSRHSLILLEQSLCLFHYAYNKKMNYDIVIFFTDDLDESDMESTRSLVSPANVKFVRDSPPIVDVIKELPPERRNNLMERCRSVNPNITVEDMDWWTYCPGRVNYNWQAEFRSWHIWRNPALLPYKYMMWLDADTFSTRPWHKDPISHMINKDLFVLFASMTGGSARGKAVQEKIHYTFNTTICGIRVAEDGHAYAITGDACWEGRFSLIHGYFHITNLDFFRSDIVQLWVRNWIGDCYLCRDFDDQAAITVPGVLLAPNRTWEMGRNNYSLGLFHNSVLDGKRVGGFRRFWKHGFDGMKHGLPEAEDVCPIKAGQ